MFARLLAVALAVSALSPASAQEFGALPTYDIGADAISYASAMAVRQGVERQLQRGSARPAPQARAPAPVDLAYAPSPALQRQALDDFLARARARNPANADIVAQQLRQHDYARVFNGLVAPFGLASDNAADAVAAYTVLCWMIANDAGDPSPAAVRAARGQFAQDLAADPRFAAPAARAALGEEMKILFVTLHAGWRSARREGTLGAYSEGVARMFRTQTGADLRALSLTAEGFAPRR